MCYSLEFSYGWLVWNYCISNQAGLWWNKTETERYVMYLLLLFVDVSFYHAALYACSLSYRKAVHPSVCPSHACDKKERKFCQHYKIWKVNSSSFLTWRMVGEWWGTSPCTWNFGPNWPNASKTAISNRYLLVPPQPLDPAKKVQLFITNRRSTRAFKWAEDEHPIRSL